MGSPIRVLIADDHSVVRTGLTSALSLRPDIEVVGAASDGREAIDKALELVPDVIIMDISMPGCSGLEATSALAHQLPQTKVLVLTVSDKDEDLFRAVRFGAQGYLLKSTSIDDIVTAVKQVAEGQAIISPYIAGKLLDQFRRERFHDIPLSAREMEVLSLVGEGLNNRQIAERLVVTPVTVKTYLQRIIDKLHLDSQAEAMAFAIRQGLSER